MCSLFFDYKEIEHENIMKWVLGFLRYFHTFVLISFLKIIFLLFTNSSFSILVTMMEVEIKEELEGKVKWWSL